MKKFLVMGAALMLAVPATIAFGGSATDRATGGGQILIGKSAGHTITFTARGTADAATGQVQYINRAAGTGRSQVRRHGTVSCLRVDGNMAKLAGTWDQGGAGTFQLIVVDNGEGAAADPDIVTVQNMQDPTCDDEGDDDDGQTELGRGNAQVYDAG